MIAIEILALLAGFAAMVLASQQAVGAATELAIGARISPFVIGFTVLALGTDLPEIANSIVSSLADHGDINVGDSVGSAATQITLVLGLLGIIAGPIALPNGTIVRTGIYTVVALGVLTLLLLDGYMGRVDALIMLSLWAVGSISIYRNSARPQQLSLPEPTAARSRLVLKVLVAFVGLGAAAILALWAVVALAERFNAPEFLVGFFLASLGTSLPELVFDLTALRKGAAALAIGDVVGSSFIDASASVAAGPLIAPTSVTTDLVVRGTLVALVAIAFLTFVLGRSREHDWRTGVILLFTYAAFFVAML